MSQQPYPMNRAQRRNHYREAKKDPIAIYCPKCNHKTRHMSIPMSSEWAKQNPVFTNNINEKPRTACNIVCVACGNILRSNLQLIPYEYIKQVNKNVDQP